MNAFGNVAIRMLTVKDCHAISRCLSSISSTTDPDTFIAPTMEYISKILSGYGYTAGAFCGCQFAGFASIVFPRQGKHNLGHILQFTDEQLLATAQLEHVCVIPKFRNIGVAEQIIEYILSQTNSKYKYLISTVAPHNTPSLSLAFKLGQRIVACSVVYNVTRFLMLGTLDSEEIRYESTEIEIHKNNLEKLIQLFKCGYEGVAFGLQKTSIILRLRSESHEKVRH